MNDFEKKYKDKDTEKEKKYPEAIEEEPENDNNDDRKRKFIIGIIIILLLLLILSISACTSCCCIGHFDKTAEETTVTSPDIVAVTTTENTFGVATGTPVTDDGGYESETIILPVETSVKITEVPDATTTIPVTTQIFPETTTVSAITVVPETTIVPKTTTVPETTTKTTTKRTTTPTETTISVSKSVTDEPITTTKASELPDTAIYFSTAVSNRITYRNGYMNGYIGNASENNNDCIVKIYVKNSLVFESNVISPSEEIHFPVRIDNAIGKTLTVVYEVLDEEGRVIGSVVVKTNYETDRSGDI